MSTQFEKKNNNNNNETIFGFKFSWGNRVFYIKIINKRARTESAAGLNDLILVGVYGKHENRKNQIV